MDDIYKNIEEYSQNKKKIQILIVFDDMIADMIRNKKLNAIVSDLFIKGKKIFLLRLLHNRYLPYQKILD